MKNTFYEIALLNTQNHIFEANLENTIS